uniref:DUF7296 family protein n=1 Tax=Tessaracoccus timonensis TaxID=2161816 RepID=UPI000D560177|nr:hypothetical protein [Tessaracoccus timonensis]
MYFFFDQNNPSGVTRQDAERGIGHFVIIEADSADAANAKAESGEELAQAGIVAYDHSGAILRRFEEPKN